MTTYWTDPDGKKHRATSGRRGRYWVYRCLCGTPLTGSDILVALRNHLAAVGAR